MKKHRVLTIAHGHPNFSYGGGEIAAYTLYRGYEQHDAVMDSYFIGASERSDSGKINSISESISHWVDRHGSTPF